MKVLITIILFITIVSMTLGALSRSNEADPNNPDNCLVDGESFTPGIHNNPSPTTCEQIECTKRGEAVISSCGVQSKKIRGKKCINEGYIDISLPYPECCTIKWSCPEH